MRDFVKKTAAGLAALGFASLATAQDLVTYTPPDGLGGGNTVEYDTTVLTGWLSDGLVAGILVGAILFGIGVGVRYLVRYIKSIGK